MKTYWILSLLVCLADVAHSADVMWSPPPAPDKSEHYVFYLHGLILENAGPRPVSPEFGVYDYPAILDALQGPDTKIIAAQRASGTGSFEFAGRVVGQIQTLLAAGVPPGNITVVGFSKGGAITLYISSFLRQPDVRYVILAGCGDWLSELPQLRLTGKVLSIIEASDTLASSCAALAKRAPEPQAFNEIVLSTGKGHGTFFVPRPVWVNPTREWIAYKSLASP